MSAIAESNHMAPGRMERLARRVQLWGIWQWLTAGLVTHLVLIVCAEWLLSLWPHDKNLTGPELAMVTDLNFVEFQETRTTVQTESQDLSEKIVEKEKIVKKKEINWENAADPTIDFTQRYVARLMVNISPNDYPARARRAEVGKVTVAVSLYISASGKIRDVKIRKIRSNAGAADLFEGDFKKAVRRILLQKTRLSGQPYTLDGEAKDFVWDTTVTFTLN